MRAFRRVWFAARQSPGPRQGRLRPLTRSQFIICSTATVAVVGLKAADRVTLPSSILSSPVALAATLPPRREPAPLELDNEDRLVILSWPDIIVIVLVTTARLVVEYYLGPRSARAPAAIFFALMQGKEILVPVATFILLDLASKVADKLYNMVMDVKETQANMSLQERIYAAFMRNEFSFFEETDDLSSAVSQIRHLGQNVVSSYFGTLALPLKVLPLARSAILLYELLSKLTVVPTYWVLAPPVGILVSAWGIRWIADTIFKKMWGDSTLYEDMWWSEQALSLMRTVRSFNNEDREIQKLFDTNKRRLDQKTTGQWRVGIQTLTHQCVEYGTLLALAFSTRLIEVTTITYEDYLEVYYTLNRVSGYFAAIRNYTKRARESWKHQDTLRQFLHEVPKSWTPGRRLPSVEGSLTFEHVGFEYPSRKGTTVLRDASFTIPQGKVVALLGSSGCGKTTAVTLLLRLYDPSEGRILLDGIDIRELDPVWLRSHIGVVDQDAVMFTASIYDNIRYGNLDATREQVEAAARLANAHEFISQLSEGYETKIGRYTNSRLSGGQRQRIAIARTLLKNPTVLILDEATSSLDAETDALVREAVMRAMAGRTTLVIAHRLSTVIQSDLIIVLKDGRVAEEGTHDELLSREGIYTHYYTRK